MFFLIFRPPAKNTHQAKAKFSLLNCLRQTSTDLDINMRARAVLQGLNTQLLLPPTLYVYSTHSQYHVPCNILAPQGRIEGKVLKHISQKSTHLTFPFCFPPPPFPSFSIPKAALCQTSQPLSPRIAFPSRAGNHNSKPRSTKSSTCTSHQGTTATRW